MPTRELDLCVTNACNLRCRYCYAAGRNMGRTALTAAEMRRAVDLYLEGAARTCDKISVSGGEPLLLWRLMPGLLGHIKSARPRGAGTELFTNGLLLSPDKARAMLKAGVKVRLSLDGEKESHDACRPSASGRSSFGSVIGRVLALPPELRARLDAVPTVSIVSYRRMTENMLFLLALGLQAVKPSFVLDEVWPAADLRELRRVLAALKRTAAKHLRSGRLNRVALKDLSGGAADFRMSNEISIGTDRFFYPSSLVAASSPALPKSLLDEWRIGSLSEGIDWERLDALRDRAYAEIKSCGADLYLGCLLCMYYSSRIRKVPLKPLLKSGEKVARAVLEAGLGEVSP
ncbi:MAG: radical SAM protein [Elusimicrobiales bacterium]|nr:radical SAM protein [Elusimicrobiales bacterium]